VSVGARAEQPARTLRRMTSKPAPLASLGDHFTLQQALEAMIHHFGCDSGTIHRTATDGHLYLRAVVGQFPPPVLDAIRTIPFGKGLAGLAASRRVPVTVCNLQSDQSGDVRPGARATGMEGAITVPAIDARTGDVVGVIGIACVAPRTYSEGETAELLLCAAALGPLLHAE